MGREIRRVTPDWKHPRYTDDDYWKKSVTGKSRIGTYMPVYDRSYEDARQEWLDGLAAHKPEECEGLDFWEWDGSPPDRDYYRPDWSDEDATHFQMYETVSEGTPLSPVFPTLEALADWLTENEDFWGQGPRSREVADAFVRTGWAPSFVHTPATGMQQGIDALPDLQRDSGN